MSGRATQLVTEPATPFAHDSTPLAGTDYTFVNHIGRGGMGDVYAAEHRTLGVIHAVKVLQVEAAHSAQLADRGRIEAQIGARIRHPNLVAVHQYGVTASGRPYLAMDLLKGESLQERLLAEGGGPLPLALALEIACQVLDGLHAVHAAGLVHRDVKPANIFLCNDGSVKLLDLGCAKVLDYATVATPESLAIPTATNVFIGSPRYMAPEQAGSGLVDGRADVYAVGLVLYRLLCGRGPFDQARSWDELRSAHLTATPPRPSEHLREPLPNGLDEVIMRCLAKDPRARPPSAEACAAELRRLELDLRTTARLDDDFITEPMAPPTTLGESGLAVFDEPPPPTTQKRNSAAALWTIIVICLAIGCALGAAVAVAVMRGG